MMKPQKYQAPNIELSENNLKNLIAVSDGGNEGTEDEDW